MEYQDQSSGHIRLALAEAPNEALPHNCRPNFGAAWLAKDKFKVGLESLLLMVCYRVKKYLLP